MTQTSFDTPVKNGETMLAQLKVLLVDDRPEILMALRLAVESFGIEATSASSGKKALAETRVKQFDLVLLDIDMPDLDGFEVCRQLKGDDRTRQIPVIFVSGRASKIDEAKAMSLGAANFITKPFGMDALKRCIQGALRGD